MPVRLCADPSRPEPAAPGCRGRCRLHAAERAARAKPVGHALYRTRRWRILRRRVLAEQPLCPCGRIAEEVDHVVPLAQGGAPWQRANLQGLCAACHGRKTYEERQHRPRATASAGR